MRAPLLVAVILATAARLSAQAQLQAPQNLGAAKPEPGSLAAIPQALLAEALELSVLASIPRPAGEPAWSATDIKYTLPGTPVTVKMVGSDVAVLVTLTPYAAQGGGLMLVIQGQVWYKDGDSGFHTRTTLETVPVAFGEKILFYPLGAGEGGVAPLVVQISLVRYDPTKSSPAPAAQDKP